MRNSKKATRKAKIQMSVNDKIQVINSRLRRGDLTLISEKTGYNPSHVGRVLNGERNNPSGKIVNTAYTMVSRRTATV
jgi:hypothetical protein